MAAFDPATLDRWRELAIVDRHGTTVGTISEFYLDRETGYPTWALVNTGLFGATRTFVPLVDATEIGDGLQVPYEKSHIKDTPSVDPHDELSPDEEATLFAHYGVEYQPSTDPVPPASDAPPSTEDPDPVPDEPGSVDDPGPVPSEPGSVEDPGPVPDEPGSVEDPGPVPDEPGSVEDPGPVRSERGSVGGSVEGPGPVPGTAEADEVTQVAPGGFGLAGEHREGPADLPDPPRTASDGYDSDPPGTAPADPDLSRTAPVGTGLPGSTAASSSGPIPMTIDKGVGADPDGRPADEPPPAPDEAHWASGAAGSFEEPAPAERSVGASDRWREAKLAAERERIARAAAAQPEERSPLERARRRLERLVGGGQEHEPDDISPTERDAAERARRARLGFDEDDPHRR